ncbi:glycosyltransferase [Flavobacterium kingsejongi]|nr:glycosyltransferase [Flavobacterium kingsejongi]
MESGISKKKILIIHHGSGLGGGLVALIGLIKELKIDHDVSVFCVFDSDAVDYLKALNVTVYLSQSKFYKKYYNLFTHSAASYNNLMNSLKKIYLFFLSLLNIFFFSARELKKFNGKFDVLYLNSLFIADWIPVGRKYGFKKTVVHVREPLDSGFAGKFWFRMLLKKYSDLIICVSKDNLKRINIKNKSICVYDPVVVRESQIVNLDIRDKNFIYLGGSQRIKGFEQLINSLEYLNDNIRILFLGPIDEITENYSSMNFKIRSVFSSYLRYDIKKLKLKFENSDKIIRIGKVNNVFDYYQNAIGIICPFAKPHACLPILEGLSIGKPFILSNVEGLNELPINDVFLQFKNGDYLDLANKINQMSEFSASKFLEISDLAKDNFKNIVRTNPNVSIILMKL